MTKRTFSRFFGLLLAVACLGLGGCVARARVRGIAYVDPPPPRAVVVRPAPPAPSYTWANGYWDWNGAQWVWVNGRWIAPRAGYVYVAPRWEQRSNGYVYIDGGYRRRHHGRSVVVQPPRRRNDVTVRGNARTRVRVR